MTRIHCYNCERYFERIHMEPVECPDCGGFHWYCPDCYDELKHEE